MLRAYLFVQRTGTTAATLNNSLNSSHGYLNGTNADILGIGNARSAGGNAKLSRERKFRMREHAISKLSHAYRLDEIATSVATMQSASPLKEVAKYVLQRNEHDPDAQCVHFFHEKIPSRAMAEHTPLTPLTDIINRRPTEASVYRTRAVTRIFKNDYLGSARDLTEGLAIHRLYNDHRRNQKELILDKDVTRLPRGKLEEKDHPNSMEPQLLFHRAGVYLALACEDIVVALRRLDDDPQHEVRNSELPLSQTPQQKENSRAQIEARKLVRTYAKRALRDYASFLSNFEYTLGISSEFTEAFLDKVACKFNGHVGQSRSEHLLNIDSHSPNGLSEALIKYHRHRLGQQGGSRQIRRPVIYKVSELFNAVPPPALPSYPPTVQQTESRSNPIFSIPEFSEAVIYHPLITDVLHSLLLCHCLVQTSVRELQRHAYMAARVARVCDGYPIFLAARSPSRADWVDVLRRTKNWLGLEQTWEELCTPSVGGETYRCESKPPRNGQIVKCGNGTTNDDLTKEEKLERIKQEAIREALADERVVDEDTFRANVRAREARAIAAEDEEMRKEYHNISPTRDNQAHSLKLSSSGTTNGTEKGHSTISRHDTSPPTNDKDSSIATERAEMIARWIREAPPPGSSQSTKGGSTGTSRRRTGKKHAAGSLKQQASDMSSASAVSHASAGSATTGMEMSVESLNMVD